jgi:hypothetical protein
MKVCNVFKCAILGRMFARPLRALLSSSVGLISGLTGLNQTSGTDLDGNPVNNVVPLVRCDSGGNLDFARLHLECNGHGGAEILHGGHWSGVAVPRGSPPDDLQRPVRYGSLEQKLEKDLSPSTSLC